MRARDYTRRKERDASRLAEQRASEDVPVERGEREWLSDQPGHPLGHGMPMGTTLRQDGESHSNAWRRILRADPCSYCGAVMAGTVDHVVPRSTGQVNVERWPNLVGACEECNRRKSSEPLLVFLLTARATARQVALIRGNRPDRTVAEAEEVARSQRRRAKRRKRERYAA